jgi:hypothetical protein
MINIGRETIILVGASYKNSKLVMTTTAALICGSFQTKLLLSFWYFYIIISYLTNQ